MRIVTWNCCSGSADHRVAQLASLDADVIILQECSRPKDPAGAEGALWLGGSPGKGVAVVARNGYRVEAAGGTNEHSVFPALVRGPHTFRLAAVWAQEEPSYVRSVLDGLERHGDFLAAGPAVIAGDFNSHPRFDRPRQKATHARIVDVLATRFGAVSAYHHLHGDAPETPTHYWQWKQSQPFHLDYWLHPESVDCRTPLGRGRGLRGVERGERSPSADRRRRAATFDVGSTWRQAGCGWTSVEVTAGPAGDGSPRELSGNPGWFKRKDRRWRRVALENRLGGAPTESGAGIRACNPSIQRRFSPRAVASAVPGGRFVRLDEVNFWSPRAPIPLKDFRPGQPVFFRLAAPVRSVARSRGTRHVRCTSSSSRPTTTKRSASSPKRLYYGTVIHHLRAGLPGGVEIKGDLFDGERLIRLLTLKLENRTLLTCPFLRLSSETAFESHANPRR